METYTSREEEMKLLALMERMNVTPGQRVTIKPILSLDARTYEVYVTAVRGIGFEGYRVKKDGERYKGVHGEMQYYTAHSLFDPEKHVVKPNIPRWLENGGYHFIIEPGRDIVFDIEQIVHMTQTTCHIERDGVIRKRRFREVSQVFESLDKLTEKSRVYKFRAKAANKLRALGIDIPDSHIVDD